MLYKLKFLEKIISKKSRTHSKRFCCGFVIFVFRSVLCFYNFHYVCSSLFMLYIFRQKRSAILLFQNNFINTSLAR